MLENKVYIYILWHPRSHEQLDSWLPYRAQYECCCGWRKFWSWRPFSLEFHKELSSDHCVSWSISMICHNKSPKVPASASSQMTALCTSESRMWTTKPFFNRTFRWVMTFNWAVRWVMTFNPQKVMHHSHSQEPQTGQVLLDVRDNSGHRHAGKVHRSYHQWRSSLAPTDQPGCQRRPTPCCIWYLATWGTAHARHDP